MPLLVDVSQPMIYVGNCAFEETSEMELSIDDFGMDTLVRTYAGRRDWLADWLAGFKVNTPDPEFPQLTLASRHVSTTRAFAYVTLTFAGLLNDELPPVIIEGGWRHQEVTLQKEDSEETVILEYKAPVTTFKYVTRKQPKRQQYPLRMAQTDAAFQVVNRRGSKGRIRYYNGAGLFAGGLMPAANDKNFFYAEKSVVCSSFNFRQVGRYWEVTEENEGRIMEKETDDRPRIISFAGFRTN